MPEILQKRTEQPRRVLILERNITGMDLMRARQRLEEERAHRQALAQRLRQEEAYPPESTELSKVDQHPAELGSETFDRELELTTLTITEAELKDIDDALRRLDAGTYGICEACGNPIEEERLAAKPWARFCIVDQAREELALSRR